MADIRHSILIDAPAERVRSLVISAAGFSEWWAADSSGTEDGAAELGFFNKSTVFRLRLESQSAQEILWDNYLAVHARRLGERDGLLHIV